MGERIVLVIDVNGHPLYNTLYRQLQECGTELEEFSHKCWGLIAPYTHHASKSPIDGAYRSLEVEIVNLCMLTFAESPGDHRSLCFDISTQSRLGKFHFKICSPLADGWSHHNRTPYDVITKRCASNSRFTGPRTVGRGG